LDYSLRIGGEAGQGVQTVGEVLSLCFATMGYHVFTNQDYESRVRGGHNFYQIRVASSRIVASLDELDLIVALDRRTIELDRSALKETGTLIYDSGSLKETYEGQGIEDIPLKDIAQDVGNSPVMANTAAVGAVLGVLGMEVHVLDAILSERFKKKPAEVAENNIKVAHAGHAHAREHCQACKFEPPPPKSLPLGLINGLEGAATGALASGLKFYSAYPMTPSTGIMNNIASRAVEYGVVVEQAEDEIAAINMALGASFAGVRAATGTSGGGFALMAEGLSLAGITETPLVIFESQRPGPATGLPTRTEQGDLLFVAHAGHGEFPRIIFAPGTPRQALMLTNKAFDLAERFQVPVFVLLDQYLGDSQWTYSPEDLDPSGIHYTDYRLRQDIPESYKRHALTGDGISPLAVPGRGTHLVVTDSDEHDEEGHLIEDAKTRIRMMDKRLTRKLPAIDKAISGPVHYGHDNSEVLLACWGSSYGPVKEAVDSLNEFGTRAAMLFFSELYPLPSGNWIDKLEQAERTVMVEGNATGQFARLIRAETDFQFNDIITRFDGRPFTPDYILGRLD